MYRIAECPLRAFSQPFHSPFTALSPLFHSLLVTRTSSPVALRRNVNDSALQCFIYKAIPRNFSLSIYNYQLLLNLGPQRLFDLSQNATSLRKQIY